jgi:hypothetical protein
MKNFTSKKYRSKRSFAPGSFRTVKLKGGKRLIIGCPRGHWSRRSKRCRVGTRSYELLTPKRRRR